jgi:SAM-dependent methyltransferase
MDNKYSQQGKDNLDIMHLAVNYNNRIFNFINSDTNDKQILEFGAGKGEFCNRFKSNVSAIEIDELMHSNINCPVYQSLEEINTKFDLIYSSNVLEHINDDNAIVGDFYNHLESGGKVRIFVPAKMILFSNMDKAVGHYRRYEKDELITLFINNGFKVEYCYFFDSLGFFASFFYKLFNNQEVISKKSLLFYDKFLLKISMIMDHFGFRYIIGKNLMLEATKL